MYGCIIRVWADTLRNYFCRIENGMAQIIASGVGVEQEVLTDLHSTRPTIRIHGPTLRLHSPA